MTANYSNKTKARIAGLLYFMVVLTGIFGLMYVPSKLVVPDNAALTFSNLANSELLFRYGISGLLCYTSFPFLTVV
ncbi:MAG: DUF4386 family protein [Chitinophagaceae bacterium]